MYGVFEGLWVGVKWTEFYKAFLFFLEVACLTHVRTYDWGDITNTWMLGMEN